MESKVMNETVDNTIKLAYENGVLRTLEQLMTRFDGGVITQKDILEFVEHKINQLDKEK
jgi:hypothetical protein